MLGLGLSMVGTPCAEMQMFRFKEAMWRSLSRVLPQGIARFLAGQMLD